MGRGFAMAPIQVNVTHGVSIIVNTRREATVIMVDAQTMFTFDAAGRLVGAFAAGRTLRRSLANDILEKQPGSQPGLANRQRRQLTRTEVQEVEDRAYATAAAVAAGLAQEAVHSPDRDAARAALARITDYSFARLEAERSVFQRTYKPITILPPDQYLALYLQATEGCSYDECTFCGFYRDRRFHMKSLAEFNSHMSEVRDFLGASLTLRRSIFLGDANALMIPQANLLPLFDAVQATFPIVPAGLTPSQRRTWQAEHPIHFQGIYSFVDAFSTRRKTAADFADLAARGLRRAYVGLETGDPALLRFLGKPNSPQQAADLVAHLKAGGVAAGIIVLIGAGGAEFAADHVRATAQLINALPLDQHDIIYFSDLLDYPGSSYTQLAHAAHLHSLDAAAHKAQMQGLRAAFTFPNPQHPPKISHYDIREFQY